MKQPVYDNGTSESTTGLSASCVDAKIPELHSDCVFPGNVNASMKKTTRLDSWVVEAWLTFAKFCQAFVELNEGGVSSMGDEEFEGQNL